MAHPSPVVAEDRSPTQLAVDSLTATVQGWSPTELQWASGYLAGLAAGLAGGAAAGAAPVADVQGAAETSAQTLLSIVYGSQTGNGKQIAERLQIDAARAGISADAISMADYPGARLRRDRLVVFVISTHGDGDPPDDALELHRFLGGRRATGLASLQYAVLGLGDSSYQHFCQTAREFDQRLLAAGAQQLLPAVECDLDYEDSARAWSGEILAQASRILGVTAETKPDPQVSTTPGPALRAVPPVPRWTREAPFESELLLKQRLSGRGSDKIVQHLELSLDGGPSYLPGDSLGVVHANPSWIVEPLIDALGLDPDATNAQGQTLLEALTHHHEITGLNRPLLEAWALQPGAEALARHLAESERGELARWMSQRQLIDIVREYPAQLSAGKLLDILRPLAPRLYSIASAPEFAPEEAHLTVALLEYDAYGYPHWGAASSWLARAREESDSLRVYVETNDRFRLPADPDAPVIMIGPGTGVAPFRGFLQARQAQGASGRNWLFFGDRRFGQDFLYQTEWLRYRRQGLLDHLDVAFSRDQAQKRYVQHVMAERGVEFFAWLEEGAHVYVCGDASRMAPDVERTLGEILIDHGNMDAESAEEYLHGLKRSGRYRRDVY
ncbi:MAG: flavodoxin domain-containing protein [Gammaproteobacteria bacterium]